MLIAFVQAREVVETEGSCVASPGRPAGFAVFVDVPGRFKHLVVDDILTSVVANRYAQRIAALVHALAGVDLVQVIGVGGEDLGQVKGEAKRRRGGWLKVGVQ